MLPACFHSIEFNHINNEESLVALGIVTLDEGVLFTLNNKEDRSQMFLSKSEIKLLIDWYHKQTMPY